MLRALVSVRGVVLVFGLVALLLPAALVAQLGIVRTLTAGNEVFAQIREGELAAAEALHLQDDEQTAIRGYAVTKERLVLAPYERDRRMMPALLADLRNSLIAAGIDHTALADVDRVEASNVRWLRTVAEPTIARGRYAGEGGVGDTLVDRFRRDLLPINTALERRFDELRGERDRALHRTTQAALVGIALIVVEIALFFVVVVRMQRELGRERGVVETLQRAAAGRIVAPRHLAIGSAYRSATRGMRLGGDVYDVYRLDADRTLLVVADVSGKGVVAAVDTTFVRYALRALAGEHDDPAAIMTRFDALYRAADGPPESFVSLFLGIHDRRDRTVRYANAGHGACWIRRDRDLEELPPTGPIVGIGGEPFGAATAKLARGELLILATDGLTEARDRSGGFVDAERVHRWLIESDAATPQRFVDAVVAAVTRYVHGRISDDLAILAVTPA